MEFQRNFIGTFGFNSIVKGQGQVSIKLGYMNCNANYANIFLARDIESLIQCLSRCEDDKKAFKLQACMTFEEWSRLKHLHSGCTCMACKANISSMFWCMIVFHNLHTECRIGSYLGP